MAKVLGFLIRYFSNYYTLYRSDLAARAALIDPRLDCEVLARLKQTEFIKKTSGCKKKRVIFFG